MGANGLSIQDPVGQYLKKAHQVLDTGYLSLDHGDYITAVNRAYYAIFYAANALLATRGLQRSKHSGVLAAFREQFVKAGIIEPEYSDFYGAVMDERTEADYEFEVFLDREIGERALLRARRFVERIERAIQDLES
jgi:uncharacterized protein (UPF0332 family)